MKRRLTPGPGGDCLQMGCVPAVPGSRPPHKAHWPPNLSVASVLGRGGQPGAGPSLAVVSGGSASRLQRCPDSPPQGSAPAPHQHRADACECVNTARAAGAEAPTSHPGGLCAPEVTFTSSEDAGVGEKPGPGRMLEAPRGRGGPGLHSWDQAGQGCPGAQRPRGWLPSPPSRGASAALRPLGLVSPPYQGESGPASGVPLRG